MNNREKLLSVIIDNSEESIIILKQTIEVYFSKDLEVIGTFLNPESALNFFQESEPDLIFLDLEMPSMNGFDLYELIPEKLRKRVVVYSGAVHYGVRVINQMEVIGFLSKPIVLKDLKKCVEKGIVLKHDINNDLSTYNNAYNDHIVINGQSKTILLLVEKIDRLESEGPYTNIFYNNTFEKTSKHLLYYQELLNPQKFIRVDRQNIVNIEFIKEINKRNFVNELILNDGYVIKLSKEKLKNLMEKIEAMLSGN